MVTDGVIDLHAQILLGPGIKIEERRSSLLANSTGIEDMISTLNGEVRLDRAGFLESGVCSARGIELRLDVTVGDKQKLKRVLRRCGHEARRQGRYGDSRTGPDKKLSAIHPKHRQIPFRPV